MKYLMAFMSTFILYVITVIYFYVRPLSVFEVFELFFVFFCSHIQEPRDKQTPLTFFCPVVPFISQTHPYLTKPLGSSALHHVIFIFSPLFQGITLPGYLDTWIRAAAAIIKSVLHSSQDSVQTEHPFNARRCTVGLYFYNDGFLWVVF